METVGSVEAKIQLPQLLERVANGEEFTITEDGKPVAKLVPLGVVKPKADVRAAVEAMKQLRKTQSLGGLSVREMIEEGRRF